MTPEVIELVLNGIRDFYGLRKNIEFARFFEISEQNANGWYKRTTLDFESIWKHCPEINPDWLLSGGEGEMTRAAALKQEAVLGDKQSESPCSSVTIERALDALREEQAITKTAQEQASDLIEIIKNTTAKPAI